MHGLSQGFFSLVDGGNFFQGFVSGALGSLGASAWGSAFGTKGVSMIAFGALSGGIGAELTGGNFFKGFVQGLVVSTLNHAVHADDNEIVDESKNATQKGEVDLEKLFKEVLKLKPGATITADEAIKKFKLDPKLKSAIKSLKLISKNKIFVDWDNEKKINMLSYINVKDGILNIEMISLKIGDHKFYNGYKITGGNLVIDDGNIYNKILVNGAKIMGIISLKPLKLTENCYGL